MSKIREVMMGLPDIFDSARAKGWNRVIEFRLGGEEPSTWTMIIENQQCTVLEGEAPPDKKVNLTISGNSEHIVQMFTGEVPPMTLVNAKKVVMKGPVMDSLSFSRLWKIPKKT